MIDRTEEYIWASPTIHGAVTAVTAVTAGTDLSRTRGSVTGLAPAVALDYGLSRRALIAVRTPSRTWITRRLAALAHSA
ncbi:MULTISPECIES: hypothetical protein [unclassified Streptomyces]|uniref:hypothetical protein n=1 Tax=unclassified Streptomyces TaxID=2593676 RepID=UPI00093D5059|nr:hypothetical protein [Streptomyces sp. TSRI0281]OKI37471.1 hypothetical protein A6A29_40925 [Streptomyces sp. TSRI0281]